MTEVNRQDATEKLLEITGLKEELEKIEIKEDKRKEIILPKLGKLISEFAKEISEILDKEDILFYRTDSRDIVEIGEIKNEKEQSYNGFLVIKPNRFITLVERFFKPVIKIQIKEGEEISSKFKPKSMTADLSNTLIQSHILQEALKPINRIFTSPIPIIYNNELTFPKKGYDERFKSWLSFDSPTIINPNMELEEAKKILYEILKEFCFQSPQDYTNAVAGLITPFLRGLYPKFNTRTPVFFYLANRERAGKDYLAGINGLIYEGVNLEEPPICNSESSWGSNDELKKKIISALLSGRKRLHFSNNKGYLNNAVFESIITAPKYSDRLLGRNELVTFDNELEFSLSGNIGITFTPDLANRSRFIRLFLDIENANDRKFERPNLHKWILENRELILSAIYSLIRNWFNNGCIGGKINFASFPEWARICGGIMESCGYDSPCKIDKETLELGGDTETINMKRLFEVCYEKSPNIPLNKTEIRTLIEEEEIFGFFDYTKKSDQVKFGNILQKFIGRILSNIVLNVWNKNVRTTKQLYVFSEHNIDRYFA